MELQAPLPPHMEQAEQVHLTPVQESSAKTPLQLTKENPILEVQESAEADTPSKPKNTDLQYFDYL
jgi:hypothetical protein